MLEAPKHPPYGEQALYLGHEQGPHVKVGELARALALKLREPARLHVGHLLLADVLLRNTTSTYGTRSGAFHVAQDMDALCGKAREWQSQQAQLALMGAAPCDVAAELARDVRALIAQEQAADNLSFAPSHTGRGGAEVRERLVTLAEGMEITPTRLQQVGGLVEQAALQLAQGALAWKGQLPAAQNPMQQADKRPTPYANVLMGAARLFKDVMPEDITRGHYYKHGRG